MKVNIKRTLTNHWLLIPLFFITSFGFGFQAIPLFGWFYVPTILLYTRYKPSKNVATAYIVSSFGFSLGFLGNFRTSSAGPRFPVAWFVILASFILHIILLATLAAERYALKHTGCIYTRVLLFPSIWTGLWFLTGRFGPLGDYPALSTVLVNWADFSQAASLGGRALLDFLIAISGTVLFEFSSFPAYAIHNITSSHNKSTNNVLLANSAVGAEEEEEAHHTTPTNSLRRQYIALLTHPITIYTLIMTFIFTYGGLYVNVHPGSFYQVTYPEYIPPKTPVGCVVGANDEFPALQANHDIWFNKSTELAEAGAKLILWSELTTIVEDEHDEVLFIERTKDFAKLHDVYIGVTYALMSPVQQNKLVFVTKEGDVGINYNKAHPVPTVEKQPAGPSVLQYIDTEEFGRIGGGICFDYNFADFIKQASTHKIDIMLQPSWTWGPIGTYHGQGNILRAVENGFTLFRCVSQGVSGIFESTLNSVLTQKVASNNVEKYVFYLPIQKRVATLYGYIGDLFSYLCLLTSGGLLFLTWWKSKTQHQLSI